MSLNAVPMFLLENRVFNSCLSQHLRARLAFGVSCQFHVHHWYDTGLAVSSDLTCKQPSSLETMLRTAQGFFEKPGTQGKRHMLCVKCASVAQVRAPPGYCHPDARFASPSLSFVVSRLTKSRMKHDVVERRALVYWKAGSSTRVCPQHLRARVAFCAPSLV